MPRKLLTPSLLISSSFTNVILVEKIPSFQIPIASVLNTPTALNKFTPKEIALLHILSQLLLRSLIESANKVTAKTLSKFRLKRQFSAINSLILNAKEDSFQEL